tara:strand:+ start:58 stop:930 length:873 start_codon:yes stop_codon:yes gene_type:complete
MFEKKTSRIEFIITLIKIPLRIILNKLSKKHLKQYKPIANYSFDYISQTIAIDGIYEIKDLELINSFLLNKFPHVLKGTCVDIGANIGNHTLFYSKQFHNILSFEALPINFKLLEINTHNLKNVKIFNYALGLDNSTRDFFYDYRNLGGSSFNNINQDSLNKISLRTKKIDDLNLNSENITFIKLDVEGSEIEVIKGGLNTIKKTFPIIAFEQQKNDFHNGSSQVIDELKKIGYETFLVSKTKPIFVNSNHIFGKLITIIYSILFSQKKVLIKKKRFNADYYPMILAIKT